MRDERYTIAFEIQAAGLAEHDYPLISKALHFGFDVIICTHSENDIRELKDIYQSISNAHNIDYYTFDDDIPFSKFDAIYSNMPGNPGICFKHPEAPLDIPRIAATHGLTDKKCKFPYESDRNPLACFNVIFATGDIMFKGSWEKYCEKYPDTNQALKRFKVGAPKTDSLFQSIYDREEILESLNLDPKKKTVIYSPTYQKEASLEQWGLEILERLCNMNINVISRLHHCSLETDNFNAHNNGNSGKNWRNILDDFCNKYPNFKHVEGDSNPYFVAADTLIGDVSGACYEFMIQDKPVIFIDCPDYFEKYGKDGIAYCGRAAGLVVENISELQAKVNEALDDDQNSDIRWKLIRKLIYHPGESADYSIGTIYSLIKGDIDFPKWGPQKNRLDDQSLTNSLIKNLASFTKESVVLYGAGQDTRAYLPGILDAGKVRDDIPDIECILDDFPPLSGSLYGIPVIKPEDHPPRQDETIVIFNDRFDQRMKRRCQNLFGEKISVYNIYRGA